MAIDINQMESQQYTLELLRNLNLCLNEYYEKTQNITQLLQEDDEEDINGLDSLINLRESIIDRYNAILSEYKSLKIPSQSEEVNYLEEQRVKLLELIKELDSYNLKRTNELYLMYKSKIREIALGKKMTNAYQSNGSFSDGVFIDKRK